MARGNWENILKVITIPQVDLGTNIPEYEDSKKCKEKIDRLMSSVKNLINTYKNTTGIKFIYDDVDETGLYCLWYQEYVQDLVTPEGHISFGKESWKDLVREQEDGMQSDNRFDIGEFSLFVKQEEAHITFDIDAAIKKGLPDDFYCKFYDLLTHKINPLSTDTIPIEGTDAYITIENKPRDVFTKPIEFGQYGHIEKKFESDKSPYRGFSYFTYSVIIPDGESKTKHTILEMGFEDRFIEDEWQLRTVPNDITFLQHTGETDDRNLILSEKIYRLLREG